MGAKQKNKKIFGFSTKGQALVEFALVIPLFLLVFIAVFDVGRMLYIKHTLDNAVREGVRAGVVETGVTDAMQTAEQMCQGVLSLFNLPDACQVSLVRVNGVDALRIDIAHVYQSLVLGGIFDVTLRANTTMRKEG